MKKIFSIVRNVLVVFIVLGAISIFASTYFHAGISSPEDESQPASPAVAQQLQSQSSKLPSRLVIPSIGVNAKVQYVGVSKHGTMAVPTNYTDVGWYKLGAIPGHTGTAVMDGHLDNGFGRPGVFKKLQDLNPGDDVMIVDKSGNTLHFKVTGSQLLDSSAKNTELVFSSNSQNAGLNLITCEGTWNAKKMAYSQRRIVFTKFDVVTKGAHSNL